MDRLAELLALSAERDLTAAETTEYARLHAALTADERTAFAATVEAAFDAADSDPESGVAVMERIDALDVAVAAEAERIVAEAARREALRGARAARREPEPEPNPNPEPVVLPVGEPEPGTGPRVAVAASARRPVAGTRSPAATVDAAVEPLVTAQTFYVGSDAYADRREAMTAAMERFRRAGAPNVGESRLSLLRTERTFREDRRLTDKGDVTEQVMALRDAVRKQRRTGGAKSLTAAGGLCNPPEFYQADSPIPEAARPLRDGLPTVNASRGGITFRRRPTPASYRGAVTQWTVAKDLDAVTNTATRKPVARFVCPTPVTAQVYGVPYRLLVGNFARQFDADAVAETLDTLALAQGQLAESSLGATLWAQAAATQSVAEHYGATRDFLGALDTAAASRRWRNSAGPEEPLVAYLPGWLVQVIASDLAREMGGGDMSHFRIGVDDVNDMLAVRNIRAVWHNGDLGFADQDLTLALNGPITTSPTTAPALIRLPVAVRWLLAGEGDVVYLDGGDLDTGLNPIRSEALDAANDVEFFGESFEGLAVVAGEVDAYVSTLSANGTAAALTSPAGYDAGTGATQPATPAAG